MTAQSRLHNRYLLCFTDKAIVPVVLMVVGDAPWLLEMHRQLTKTEEKSDSRWDESVPDSDKLREITSKKKALKSDDEVGSEPIVPTKSGWR